jgi:PHD/YefM family antitoxin component YafN of YafNO toxin-antitoxin module
MSGVTFATISELDKQATALVKEAEKPKSQIVITKRGKPVGLLRKVTGRDRGRIETVSSIKNRANELLSSIEKGNGQIVITRNNQPVVVLKRIGPEAFSIKEYR